MRFRLTISTTIMGTILGILLVAPGCERQSLINVDVGADGTFQDVTLQLQINDLAPKRFHKASFGPEGPFKATVFIPSSLNGTTVRIVGRADDGTCVLGRGGPVSGVVGSTPVSLTISRLPVCEPLDSDAGSDVAATGTGGSGGSGGAGGSGGTGTTGTGGTVGMGTGGAGLAGTGGAIGGGTGGAVRAETGGAIGSGTGGAVRAGTGGAGTGGAGRDGGGADANDGAADRPADPCTNNVKDPGEADVDCGGISLCPRCGEDKACGAASDCAVGAQCAFGACHAKYPPIDSSLVGYWPLNTDTKDLSGNGNHAMVYQNATPIGGKVGGAYQMNGNACLVVPDSASLDMVGGNTLTMMAWIDLAGSCTTGEDVTVVINKESSYEMAISCTNAEYQAAIAPGGASVWAWQGTYVIKTNNWHHVATVWDGSLLKLYVDGVAVDSFAQSGKLANTSFGLGLGCRTVSANGSTGGLMSFFVGAIDEAAIYKRVLSPAEIAAYYNATK